MGNTSNNSGNLTDDSGSNKQPILHELPADINAAGIKKSVVCENPCCEKCRCLKDILDKENSTVTNLHTP